MKKFASLLFGVLLVTNFAFSQAKVDTSKINSLSFITTSDSVKLFTKVSGNGPVCIFVHGGPGAWSKSFEEMGGNSLETKLRMVYFDQRGSGRSDTSVDNNYSLDRMVEDIENIRRSAGVEKIYLLSHSFGGIIATNYAKKYPNHLLGLILANSTLSLNNSLEQQIKHINKLTDTNFTVTDENSILPTFSSAKQKLIEKGLDYKMLSDNKNTVEKLDSIDYSYKRTYDFAKKVWNYKAFSEDFTKDTKSIKVPVLIIAGKKDYSIGVDHYKLFQFPTQKLVNINGGHVLYYEQNKAFTEAVFSFIK